MATASATAVTALLSWIIDPWPARPRAVSRIHIIAFSAVSIRYSVPLAAVAARDRQREAADLADRLGHAVEQVGPVVDQPLAAVLAAGLLVGDEREHQVARRHDARAFEVPGDRDHHPDHVLHVDRAAAPDVAVLDRAGERMHAPVGRLGGHHVEVAVQHQGAALAVGALQSGEHVGPARRAGLDVFGRVADLLELLGHPAGAFGLTFGGLGLAGVGGVEADERADEIDHLGFGCRWGRAHSHLSYHLSRRLGLGPASVIR